MRKINPYQIEDGDVLEIRFPFCFTGVRADVHDNVFIYALEENDAHTHRFKMHVVIAIEDQEADVRKEWLVASNAPVFVFAERLS